jgi:ABC-2 type transport system ATP-binding protein
MSVVVKDLAKVYGTQRAVDSISFSVEPGDVLGFLGPNGAGKTTTMKMITGYIPMTEGSVEVSGISVSDEPLGAAAKIGYLPEHNPLYKDMYIREYLEFVAGLYGIRSKRDRISEMIHVTGLEREKHKKIHQLSKGYRQRVGLAQAMIHDPEVLILDEPTSGLDPNQLKEIRQLIAELGKQKTLIFSTHIMQEVQALCNRVIIIDKGKLVADDPIEKLQARISGDAMVYVSFDKQIAAAKINSIDGVLDAVALDKSSWQIRTASDKDIRPALFKLAVDSGMIIMELKQERLSVEQIFQELTNV